jgi:uncharacterized glyoxalase superfamily protein PhnB
MNQEPRDASPTIVPYFVYRGAAAALRWLSAAFGFETLRSFPAPDGSIVHAEMRVGSSANMLGTAAGQQAESPWDLLAGRGIYVVVDDVDAHHARARAGGAHIVLESEDTEFGTRRYRALDLDGYEWSFGTYQPSLDSG